MTPAPRDMFGLLLVSILAHIENGKASNACTLVNFYTHIADKRLDGLAKNLATDPTSLRTDFRVGHSTLTLPDVPYSHISALESNGVLTSDALNRMCFITGYCNMALVGKFACFKAKYLVRFFHLPLLSATQPISVLQGVAPAKHNDLHDMAVVFVLRMDESIESKLGDLLLFSANCMNVIGIESSLFKTIVSTHWDSLTSQQKHAGKHKTPIFRVGELDWMLTPEQETEIIRKGVAELPVREIFEDAVRLQAMTGQVREREKEEKLVWYDMAFIQFALVGQSQPNDQRLYNQHGACVLFVGGCYDQGMS
jgi:hypothetical protein